MDILFFLNYKLSNKNLDKIKNKSNKKIFNDYMKLLNYLLKNINILL